MNSRPDSFTVVPPLCTPPCENPSTHGPCPTLVIGSGVSAADVIKANTQGNSIIHIYKWNSQNNQCPLRKFDQELYPEYHEVYRKMKFATLMTEPCLPDFFKDFEFKDDDYEGLANAEIFGLSPDGIVDIKLENGEKITRRVGKIELRTGRSGSLDYLSPRIFKQRGSVTKDTFRSVLDHNSESTPLCIAKNVFIIGSLCGDTLVRFLHGSCLKVRKHIDEIIVA
jgi:hypothetical protein